MICWGVILCCDMVGY